MKTTSTTATLALQTLLWLGISMGTLGAELWIKNVDEFIQLKNDVSNGNYYSGTTVFIDSDIDFSCKTFEPIGNSDSIYFNGTLDGQGHVIDNLNMTSSSQHVGLFGYSGGLTIKNVILDSSCSIKSFFNAFNYASVGGIVGYCIAENGPCTIENSVNMASVTFNGKLSSFYNLYLGGIAGYLFSYYYSHNYETTVKNCANYGGVTHSGNSDDSYIGGIVGTYLGSSSSSKSVHIQFPQHRDNHTQ